MLVATLRVPAADAELASDRLWAVGARAVEERSLGAVVELRTTLGPDRAIVAERVGELPDRWVLGFDEVDERPDEAWRDFVEPILVSERLTIVPAWLESSRDDVVRRG